MVSQDGVVRYANRYFPLPARSGAQTAAQSKVLVCEGRRGNLSIEYRGQALGWKEIEAPVKPEIADGTGPCVRMAQRKQKWVPAGNHPWREAIRRAAQRKAS